MMPPDALPLHLMLSMMQSASLPYGFQPWSANWPNFAGNFSNPFLPKSPLEKSAEAAQMSWLKLSEQLHQNASEWLSAWGAANPNADPKNNAIPTVFQPAFLQSIAEESYTQTHGFLEGIHAYLHSDYQRTEPDYTVLWQRGSARLLDLDPENTEGVAIFCIPSLINKYYILDLYPDVSFAQHLKAQGFRPLILDWGVPGDHEIDFTTADYITSHALDALQTLREQHDGPIAVLGYCMGGVFALALTQLAQLFVDALILLATPWDFSAKDTPRILLEPAAQLSLRQWIRQLNPVPPIVTQTVFHLINPWHVQEKYRDFITLRGEERTHFLALEQWVNDGTPLPQKVAEECFVDWPQGNMLANHQWKVGRKWIEPAAITCPTLCVIPTRDMVVPQGVAKPLAAALTRADTLYPDAGHVGMVAGRRAKDVLWNPLSGWLKSKF